MKMIQVLVVEDDPINALIFEKLLKGNINTTVAFDSTAALQYAKFRKFDLILMDINLGKDSLDGTEILRLLRINKEYAETPVFAVTCYTMPGEKERFLKEGFDRYFAKPINKNELMRAIKEYQPEYEFM